MTTRFGDKMNRFYAWTRYDVWKTRSDLDDAPQEDDHRPEVAVFTESDAAALVEEMRAKCEAIAREMGYPINDPNEFDRGASAASGAIARGIAALRRP